MNRPLVWVAVCIVAGAYGAAAGLLPHPWFPLVLAVLGTGIAIAARRHRFTAGLGLLAAALGGGALLWQAHHQGEAFDPLHRRLASYEHAVQGEIEGTVRLSNLENIRDDYATFVVDVDRLHTKEGSAAVSGGVVVMRLSSGAPVFAGDRVRVAGLLRPAIGHVNPHTSSYEDYMHCRGVYSSAEVWGAKGVTRLAPGKWWSLRYWASRLRYVQAQRLIEAVPESAEAFALAIWLGYRSRMSSDAYTVFVESGMAHILAVSGLHIAIVFFSASYVLRPLLKGAKTRSAVCVALILVFVLMSGVRPSCIRAAIMLILFVAADWLGRERDAPTALAISALLFTVWNPDLLLDTGVQLSFASLASLLLFAVPISDGLQRAAWPVPKAVADGLGCSMGVQLLSAPIAIRSFHLIALAGPAVNLVAIPLTALALWLCFAASICGLLLPPAALLFGHALAPVVWLLWHTASAVSEIGPLHPALVTPQPLAVLCFLGAMATATAFLRDESLQPRRGLLSAALVLALLTVVLWRPWQPEPMAVVLDVGHGDAIFFRSPEGRTVLIDGGEVKQGQSAGKRLVAPFLWSNHVTRLDHVLVTHSDSDHVGGLLYILEHFDVGQVYMGPYRDGTRLEKEFLDLCEAQDVPVQSLAAGDFLELGGAVLEVLHPPESGFGDHSANDRSLAARLDWAGASILLTGDIEAAGEGAVAAEACAATFLKVPHHGSLTSSSTAFLDAVSPTHALVSTGWGRSRHGASRAIIERYTARGIQVWRTDVDGGIALTQTRRGIHIEAARGRFAETVVSPNQEGIMNRREVN